MASSKEYLDLIMERLSGLDDITYKPMMGEYLIYYHKTLVGGIYDDRFLIKPTTNAIECMDDVIYELPYKGAKQMLCVNDTIDEEHLAILLNTIVDDLSKKTKN